MNDTEFKEAPERTIVVDWPGRTFFWRCPEKQQTLGVRFRDLNEDRREDPRRGRRAETDYFKACCVVAAAQSIIVRRENPTDWQGPSETFLKRALPQLAGPVEPQAFRSVWKAAFIRRNNAWTDVSDSNGSARRTRSKGLFTGNPFVLGPAPKEGEATRHLCAIEFWPKEGDSEHPHAEDVRQFCEKVREFLEATETLPQLTVDAVLRDRLSQFERRAEQFDVILQRHRLFGGRATAITLLNEFIKGDASFCLLTGMTGVGKTALLSAWMGSLDHGRYVCIPHFISPLLSHGTEERVLLENLCGHLAQALRVRGPMPRDEFSLREFFVELLGRDAPQGERIVVVIDGLDEALRSWTPDATLLPRQTGRGVYVILSARVMADKNWVQDLGIEAEHSITVELHRFVRDEIVDLLRRVMPDPNGVSPVADRLYVLSEGDPFYLRELLRDLERVEWDTSKLREHPIGANAYLKSWWRNACDICAQVGENAFVDLMGSLAVARAPLCREVLLALSKEDAIRGATFARLTDAAARFLIGSADAGYQLAHRRVAEFAVNEMSDEIEIYHDRFASLILRWNDTSLPDRVREYALDYTVPHLVDAGRVEELLQLLTPAWMNAQRAMSSHTAHFARCLDEATDALCALTPTDELLVKLLALARWKQLASEPERPRLFGTELALLARRGDSQRAVIAARQFGEPDDQFVTLAECVLTLIDGDPRAADELLSQLTSAAGECRPETVEAIAVRLACAQPATSVDLARLISVDHESEFAGEERPNTNRCLFRVFARVAEANASTVIPSFERLTTVAERAFAAVGSLSTLLRTRPASREVDAIVRWVCSEETIQSILPSLAKFLFWAIDGSPTAIFLCALDRISQIDRFLFQADFPIEVITRRLDALSTDSLNVLSQLPEGEVRDFVASHLGGARSADAPSTFDDIAAQLAESTNMREFAAIALKLSDQLESSDWRNRTLSAVFAAMAHEFKAGNLPIVTELLRRLAAGPSDLRNRVIRWCAKSLEDVAAASCTDASRVIGTAVANAFLHGDSLVFSEFQSALEGIELERHRLLLCLAVASAIPESAVSRFAANFSASARSEAPPCLPSSLARVLAQLAARIPDQEVARQTLWDSVALLGDVKDAITFREVGRHVFRCALGVGSGAAAEVIQCGSLHPDSIAWGFRDFAEGYKPHVQEHREQWIRALLAHAVHPIQKHQDKASFEVAVRALGAPRRARCAWHDVASSGAMDSGLFSAIQAYQERFQKDAWSRTQLKDGLAALALVDWSLFMRVARQADFGGHAIHLVDLEGLSDHILTLNESPDELLRDIRDLRQTQDCVSRPIPRRDEFAIELAVLSAVHAPALCVECLHGSSADYQQAFAKRVRERNPACRWGDEDIGRGSQVLDDVTARCEFLRWLTSHGHDIPHAVVDHCITDTKTSESVEAVAEAARLLSEWHDERALGLCSLQTMSVSGRRLKPAWLHASCSIEARQPVWRSYAHHTWRSNGSESCIRNSISMRSSY